MSTIHYESYENNSRIKLDDNSQHHQPLKEDDNNNNNDETNFECVRFWLAKSGNARTSKETSFSSTIVIPKKKAIKYRLDKPCTVLLREMNDGIFLKKLKL
jgi:hypothetical protein